MNIKSDTKNTFEPPAVVNAGELKDFTDSMADAYNPSHVEAAWDLYWEKQGYYEPNTDSNSKPFVMVIPPPNVTGNLHIGHALTFAIQDCVVRYHRMCGRNVLWIPGTDHAGIATQVVVEKQLFKKTGQTRHNIGREEFIKLIWKWKEENGNKIHHQIRKLGASVDWKHCVFTMDEKLSRAVSFAFVKLFEKNMIYRSNRLVNWSCALRTAISNIEVDHIEIDKPTMFRVPQHSQPVEFGVLHSFAYQVQKINKNDEDEYVIVATTRIETMLADVAVAVHSKDDRYNLLIGKTLIHPFIPDRMLKIVIDDTLVDPNFGTGCVKITPAHDQNDFDCGQRHLLPVINIFNDDGTINENGGKFQGMGRFEVRTKIIEALTSLNLYKGKTPNKMTISFCSRSKDIVEPLVRAQWWVNCQEMATKALKAVESRELRLIPKTFDKTWNQWLSNIQDWCISRQLWWGHRIPAYKVLINNQIQLDEDHQEVWIIALSEQEALQQAHKLYSTTDSSQISLKQDDDVLDTWFSSGLFPFSVLGWPDKNSDMDLYYPGQLLETGHDILFFWVARMVMMGLSLTDKLPFNTVYLHAMVRDKYNRKMSKTLGNVIDPLDIISGITLQELQNKLLTGNLDKTEIERATEGLKHDYPDGIPQVGSDALRFGLLAYTQQGRDINLDIQRIIAYRQFGNKIWQATRFALKYFNKTYVKPISLQKVHESIQQSNNLSDQWIMSRLHTCVVQMNQYLIDYEFANATNSIYRFWLYDFCDVFLELIKPIVKSDSSDAVALQKKSSSLDTLFVCLEFGLKLLHPFMPFISEELYHRIQFAVNPNITQITNSEFKPITDTKFKLDSLMIQSYPQPQDLCEFDNTSAETTISILNEIVKNIRSSRAALNLVKQKIDLYIKLNDKSLVNILKGYRSELQTLALANKIVYLNEKESVLVIPLGSLSNVITIMHSTKFIICEIYIPMKGLVDFTQELIKMEKSLNQTKKNIEKIREKMNLSTYNQTPEDIKVCDANRLAKNQQEATRITQSIDKFTQFMSAEDKELYKIKKIKAKHLDINKIVHQIAKFKLALSSNSSKANNKTLCKIQESENELQSLQNEIAKLN